MYVRKMKSHIEDSWSAQAVGGDIEVCQRRAFRQRGYRVGILQGVLGKV